MAWRWRRTALRETRLRRQPAGLRARGARRSCRNCAARDLVPGLRRRARAGARPRRRARRRLRLRDRRRASCTCATPRRRRPPSSLAIAAEIADRDARVTPAGRLARSLVHPWRSSSPAPAAPSAPRSSRSWRARAIASARSPAIPARVVLCGRRRRRAGRRRHRRRPGAGARRRRRSPTTSSTRWSPSPRAPAPFAERERRAAGELRRARAPAPACAAIVYLGGLRPGGPPALGAPAQPPARSRRCCSARRPESRGAARVDRDQRRLALVPLPRAARRAFSRPAAAGLARPPHAADRRPRRASPTCSPPAPRRRSTARARSTSPAPTS